MKNTKQFRKLNNLQVKAEKCLTREEAKKIIDKANKTQNKIDKQFSFYNYYLNFTYIKLIADIFE